MDRRSFVKATSALSVTAALPAFAQTPTVRAFSPKAGDWRSFEVVHRVELLKPVGATKVWIPIPVVEGGYQRNLDTKWTVSSGHLVSRLRIAAGQPRPRCASIWKTPVTACLAGESVRSAVL